jgi:hypothetical protein
MLAGDSEGKLRMTEDILLLCILSDFDIQLIVVSIERFGKMQSEISPMRTLPPE